MEKSEYRKKVGRILANARERAGLTQAEVADHAGVSTASVGMTERGKMATSPWLVDEMLKACGYRLVLGAVGQADLDEGEGP